MKVYKCKVVVKKMVDIVVSADSKENALAYLNSSDEWHELASSLSDDAHAISCEADDVSEITTPVESPWDAEDIPFGMEPSDAGIAEIIYEQSKPFPRCGDESVYDEWFEKLKEYASQFDKIRNTAST